MNGNIEYERKISEYDWDNLSALWESIESGTAEGWGAGRAFEYLVLRAFQLDGLDIRWPYHVGKLEQIDGVVYLDSLAFLIECKDQSESVNIEPVAKLRNQLYRRPPSAMGIVFSRSGFTDSAIILEQRTSPQRILLWEGQEVAYALNKRCMRKCLIAKYRHCIENALPNYYLKAEDLP
jgi:hypothetical protein